MSFYDDVLRQLIAALGAALFIGNLVALLRHRADVRRGGSARPAPTKATASAKSDGASAAKTDDLPAAPIGRTVGYMLLGLVVMVWGVASLLAG